MTDYRPLLSRAITSLDPNTGEARRAVYDRARTALVNQLRGMNPPLAESDITRERLALEEAIRRIEGEANQAAAAPAGKAEPAATARPEPAADRNAPVSSSRERPQKSNRPSDDLSLSDDQDPFAPSAPPSSRAEIPREPREQREPRGPAGRDAGMRPRGPNEPGGGQRPRPGRGKSPADYAREDARRAMRTRLVVGGVIGALFLLAAFVGYVHRERIMAMVGLGSPPAVTSDADGPKTPDRIAPDSKSAQLPKNQQAPAPLPPTGPAVGASQRAVLFEENTGAQQQVTSFNGTATWRTETVNPGPGRAPDVGVRVDVEIPDRRMKAVFTIRRNPDPSLPASHYIEVQFGTTNDPYGGISQMPAVRVKNNDAAQGIPLVGLSVQVMQGFFLVGLSAVDADRERNLQLLRSQNWIDIPFVYNNGRRAVLAFEKGSAGEQAMNEALAAWGN